MTKFESGEDDVPADFEQARLAILDSLKLLDTPPEREFDAIVQLAQHLTGYKRPNHIEFRDALPKTNVGKILRRALRASV